MSKIIPYQTLLRQQHVSFLKHKQREYREREDYLLGLRKLIFQVEAQMRQAELEQLEVFQEAAEHFQLPVKFPDLGDRVGLQEFFATDPYLAILKEFLAGRLTSEESCDRLLALQEESSESES